MNGTWRDKMHTPDLAVGVRRPASHALGNLGLGAGWNSSSGSEDDLSRLGFRLGAGAQTDVDAHPDQMHPSDVRTCNHLGRRVAAVTRQLNLGRAASSPAASSAPIH
jgi:hypothetical protein